MFAKKKKTVGKLFVRKFVFIMIKALVNISILTDKDFYYLVHKINLNLNLTKTKFLHIDDNIT